MFNKQHPRLCYTSIYNFDIDVKRNNKQRINPLNLHVIARATETNIGIINMSVTHPQTLLTENPS